MISLLLTIILSFASDSCNNKDIILILGYNYNIMHTDFTAGTEAKNKAIISNTPVCVFAYCM